MEYQGRKICGINIKDGDQVIVSICDEKVEVTNGYTVEVVPHTEESKS